MRLMIYKIEVSDKKFDVEIGEIKEGIAQVTVNGEPYEVLIENYDEVALRSAPFRPAMTPAAAPTPPPKAASATPKVRTTTPVRADAPATVAAPRPVTPIPTPAHKKVTAKGEILAPIPGRIMDVKVREGDIVKTGQTLATMEAMKMENNIVSTLDGIVKEVRVQKDSEVATGQVIMVIG